MEQIDIKDISGAIQLTTLINEGCKRKFTLMKEDYIMLKFSLENPIYFKLGSYVECNFGLFEMCDLQKPAFNTNTAGYDYELRLDATGNGKTKSSNIPRRRPDRRRPGT